MKTVLILVPRLGVGGISKIGSFVANTLADNYRTYLVSLIPDKPTSTISDNVFIKTLSYSFDNNKINPIISLYQKARTIIRLRKLIVRQHVSLICSFGFDLGNIANIASKGLKCKTIVSERGNPYRYNKKQKKKYDRVIEKSDAIVFQTHMAKEAFSNCDIEQKSFIIQNPATSRNGMIDIKNNSGKKKRIVYCGRLSIEKNIDMLLDAYYMLNNKEYKLCIYGDGPEYNHIFNKIKGYHLEERVELIRGCNDVFSLESNSEIFVITSNEEGMPNSLIEAMMCGMTCIATDCPPGGCRELLRDGERGILVPVNNTIELVKALKRVIYDHELSKEYGRKALSINDTNSADKIKKEWKSVVGGLLDDDISKKNNYLHPK